MYFTSFETSKTGNKLKFPLSWVSYLKTRQGSIIPASLTSDSRVASLVAKHLVVRPPTVPGGLERFECDVGEVHVRVRPDDDRVRIRGRQVRRRDVTSNVGLQVRVHEQFVP
jgi:hypothetical protein